MRWGIWVVLIWWLQDCPAYFILPLRTIDRFNDNIRILPRSNMLRREIHYIFEKLSTLSKHTNLWRRDYNFLLVYLFFYTFCGILILIAIFQLNPFQSLLDLVLSDFFYNLCRGLREVKRSGYAFLKIQILHGFLYIWVFGNLLIWQ